MNSVERHRCPYCKEIKKYSAEHDAYYCSYCNVWLEHKCKDKKCQFCKDRPWKPSLI